MYWGYNAKECKMLHNTLYKQLKVVHLNVSMYVGVCSVHVSSNGLQAFIDTCMRS